MTVRGSPCDSTSLADSLKFVKLAKNLVYFDLYCRGVQGKSFKYFPRDVNLYVHENFRF